MERLSFILEDESSESTSGSLCSSEIGVVDALRLSEAGRLCRRCRRIIDYGFVVLRVRKKSTQSGQIPEDTTPASSPQAV